MFMFVHLLQEKSKLREENGTLKQENERHIEEFTKVTQKKLAEAEKVCSGNSPCCLYSGLPDSVGDGRHEE